MCFDVWTIGRTILVYVLHKHSLNWIGLIEFNPIELNWITLNWLNWLNWIELARKTTGGALATARWAMTMVWILLQMNRCTCFWWDSRLHSSLTAKMECRPSHWAVGCYSAGYGCPECGTSEVDRLLGWCVWGQTEDSGTPAQGGASPFALCMRICGFVYLALRIMYCVLCFEYCVLCILYCLTFLGGWI